MRIPVPLYAYSIENQTFASRKNKSGIMLDLWEKPGRSRDKIYKDNKKNKNNKFTKNLEDYVRDFSQLKISNCMKFYSFSGKYYPKYYLPQQVEMLFDKCEEAVLLIKENGHVVNNNIIHQICRFHRLDNPSKLIKSKLRKSPMNYDDVTSSMSYKQNIFSKFFKLFWIESLNLQRAIKKAKKSDSKDPCDKISFRIEILYYIVSNFVRFLRKYDFSEQYLKLKFRGLDEALDEPYKLSEEYYFSSRGRLTSSQKQRLIDKSKEYNNGKLAKMFGISKKRVSDIIKSRA